MAESLGWNFVPSRDWGEDWREYFTEYTEQLAQAKADDTGPEVRIEVEVRGALESDPTPPQAEKLFKMLDTQDRPTTARYRAEWQEGAVFKSGPRAGEKRPDKVVHEYAIATDDLEYPAMLAVWVDNKLVFAKFKDYGEPTRETSSIQELTAWLKGSTT
jgi:hypothetical protein